MLHLANLTLRLYKDELGLASDNVTRAFLDAVVAWRWVNGHDRCLTCLGGSTLRWRSWMSHLLTVDAHLGVAARLRYLDKGAELLPPSRSSSRPGCRQARSTSGGSTAGLRITVVANPQKKKRDHRSSCTPLPVELPVERAGPSKMSVPAVSLALLPTTRCRSLHRRVCRSFWRGRFGCVAAPAVAMPESDLEVTAMLSRATERVGLEWRKPPCPEPSRLDD